MISRAAHVEPLEPRRLLSVGVLADVNTTASSHGLAPVATVGERMICVPMFFGSRTDGLFATDGTAEGTVRLTAERAAGLALSGGRVFFVVGNTTLWSTDGTPGGTRAVAPLPGATTQGLTGSSADVPFTSRSVNGIVYIGGKDGLWRSDGTAAGTVRLLAADGTAFAGVKDLFQRNSDVFFTVTTGDGLVSVWRTDGTEAGTIALRGLDPTSGFARLGRNVYFLTADALWRTTGTRGGTVRVRAFAPDELNIFSNGLGAGGGKLFFTTVHTEWYPDPVSEPRYVTRNRYLWSSDGSAAGTAVIADFGDGSGPPHGVGTFLPVGDGVVFAMHINDPYGNGDVTQLWRSDGTKSGTVFVKSFGQFVLGGSITAGKSVYFTAVSPAVSGALWKTNGTSKGTYEIASFPRYITTPLVYGDGFYFDADRALYRSDGTAAGTAKVPIPLPQYTDAQPSPLFGSGATRFFAADDGTRQGIWKTDGTTAGTKFLAERLDTEAFRPVEHDGALYLLSRAVPELNRLPGLWKITAGGMTFVKEVPTYSPRGQLISAGGRLYFTTGATTSQTSSDAPQLWTSDGTPGGTHQVEGINFIQGGMGGLFALAGRAYFTASHKGNVALWTTDGTPAGTVRLRDVGWRELAAPRTAVGDIGYFNVSDGNTRTLWRTNGTAGGTVKVRDGVMMAGDPGARLGSSSTVVFGDYDGLWRTDGTGAGTVRLLEFGTLPDQFVALGSRVFFTIAAKRRGRELWVTDGTTAGTRLVKDIRAGAEGSEPADLTVFNGALHFSADDGTHGRELWRSDGTPGGTVLVEDLVPGPIGSRPEQFGVFGDRLIFRAMSDTVGTELFVLDD